MEVKKGYKQTEVGVIPEDWEISTIKECASIKTGKKILKIIYLMEHILFLYALSAPVQK